MPLNILLADDDTDDRFFFAKALNELPVKTHLITVHDGEQLMNYLSTHLFDLPDVLFLDLSMPQKSGFECLAEIKENRYLTDMPVIMFSTAFPRDTHYEQSLIKTLLNIGAEGFIRKPSDFNLLKEIIHQLLNKISINRATLRSKFLDPSV